MKIKFLDFMYLYVINLSVVSSLNISQVKNSLLI